MTRARHVDLPEDLETVAVRELHIHENHVGDIPRSPQPADGLAYRSGRPYDMQVGEMLRERAGQALPGHDLVLNNQYSHNSGIITKVR